MIDLHHGDCLDIMPTLEADSVDTIICDPPYGLSFMGKDWDHGVPGPRFWREALRVAKPGAMLLAFGGTRTFHRLACAIEDAGWELRDTISWLYGSGFPKSHNIGKALNGNGADWHGWGTALKPAWEPVIVAMKPLDGTFAQNALQHGVAGLWIDGARVGTEDDLNGGVYSRGEWISNPNEITGPRRKLPGKYIQPSGRWPANLIHDGSAEVLAGFPVTGKSIGGGGMKSPVWTESTPDKMLKDYGDNVGYGDTGSAARFFMACPPDQLCAICNMPMTPRHGIMSAWKTSHVPNAERSLAIIRQAIDGTALESVHKPHAERIAQNAPFAESLCDLCATHIAVALVETKTSASSQEGLQAIQDCIASCDSFTLTRSLASFAALWESIDTTPTTESLTLLYGSVLHAIESCTKAASAERAAAGSDPETVTRFRYTPKASRSERNAGLEGMAAGERRPLGISNWKGQTNGSGETMGPSAPQSNHHPTVKPIALMRYLARLTKTPAGGVVLDPFMGSGSTGIGAVMEGRDFIGIEQDADYIEIARRRIEHWAGQPRQEELLK